MVLLGCAPVVIFECRQIFTILWMSLKEQSSFCSTACFLLQGPRPPLAASNKPRRTGAFMKGLTYAVQVYGIISFCVVFPTLL